MSIQNYPLVHSAILDSGSTLHIFNQISRFLDFRVATPGECVWAGDHKIPIRGYGEVDITVQTLTGGTRILRLYDVAYCKEIVCNLVSLRKLRRRGIYWDNKPRTTLLRRSDESVLCALLEKYDQFILEYIPEEINSAAFFARRNRFNTWTKKRPQRAEALTWHLRLGHPGPGALEHLVNSSQGVRIKGITTAECSACAQGKLKRQIRRTPREVFEGKGERLAVDFHDFEGDQEGYSSLMLITCRTTGYSWDFYLKDRTSESIKTAFGTLFGLLDRQYGIKPKVIESDNEITTVKPKVRHYLERDHQIRLEPSPPYTQDLNGAAERSGGVLKEKIRSMRAGTKLPNTLWREITRTAVYLLNRTPRYKYNWRTPYESFHSNPGQVHLRKPDQAHLRVFGCKAYALTAKAMKKEDRLKRLNPKAWIGYLIGYNSTHIYRIWNPVLNKVVVTRDVIFDEQETFDGNLESLKDDIRELNLDELADLLRKCSIPNQEQVYPVQEEPREEVRDLDGLAEEEIEVQPPEEQFGEKSYSEERFEFLPTPPYSPPAAMLAAAIRPLGILNQTRHARGRPDEEEVLGKNDQSRRAEHGVTQPMLDEQRQPNPRANFSMLGESQTRHTSPVEKLTRDAIQTRHESSSNTTAGKNLLIVSENELSTANRLGDNSQSRSDNPPVTSKIHYSDSWQGAFLAGTRASVVKSSSEKKRMTRAQAERLLRRPGSIHRKDLPAPPKHHAEIENHALGRLFEEAEKTHLQSHKEMKSWIELSSRDPQTKGHKILDCKWVYVYKFDKHGRLDKAKARLVVRGDQQLLDPHQSSYAATLAGRSFRTLMAISARFDLELLQYDAVNAFVNAELDEEVFMKMPPGYRTTGRVLKLRKALYGLRRSPLLWQRALTQTLRTIGFKPTPHEPCCFTKNGVLLFFYVDDIALAFKEENRVAALELMAQLQARYKLTGGNNLHWFLGIEILRDRDKKLIWLSQSSYVEKIANLAQTKEKASTPMAKDELLPFEGLANKADTVIYLRKVGSLLYAAVITRPDVAFAVSRLARFTTNPGPEHQAAADRVLMYLQETSHLAPQYGGEDDFRVASDASFADNRLDRKSTQVYTMKLFGGMIGWRANKQETVTTSTTEAELLALSQAAKEALYVSRLLQELKVGLDDNRIKIECDNTQTIRLVTAEIATLKTNLRHVDIHNHWLRQEVQNERISVCYTKSAEMMADGLTKALPPGAWKNFLEQMNLQDVRQLLAERRKGDLEDQMKGQTDEEAVDWE